MCSLIIFTIPLESSLGMLRMRYVFNVKRLWILLRNIIYRKSIAIALLIVLLIYFCFADPIHYITSKGWRNPCDKAIQLLLNSNTLFLGDLHIKKNGNGNRFKCIKSFILRNNVSTLVLVGDVFDDPNIYYDLRKELGNDEAVIRYLLKILDIEDLKLNIYFIAGGVSHDPQDMYLNVTINDIYFQSVGKCLRLEIYSHRIIAIHGDIVVGGPFGFIITRIFNKPIFENLLRSILNIDKDTWVIMGHTHVPLI
ncbi:MAG: hypothetical protein DRO15_04895, partial [Thermoprotei archaeon]